MTLNRGEGFDKKANKQSPHYIYNAMKMSCSFAYKRRLAYYNHDNII